MEAKELPAPTEVPNGFISMLDKTPALLVACIECDASTGNTQSQPWRSPLTALRLVCRAAQAVASRAVTSYTLTLNQVPGRSMSREVQLLAGACLASFGVEIIDKALMRPDGEHVITKTDCPSMQAQQLSGFLNATKAALNRVTSLTIKIPYLSEAQLQGNGPNLELQSLLSSSDPYGLSAMVEACPALRHISLSGSLGFAALKQFGSKVIGVDFRACRVHPKVMDKMHILLPHLQDVQIHKYAQGIPEVLQHYNLSRMMLVTTLTMDALCIDSDQVWVSLPPNLARLSCASLHWAPPLSVSLQVLTLTEPSSTLRALAGMFRSAPVLKTICAAPLEINSGMVSGISLDHAAILSVASDLTLVNSKHESGMLRSPSCSIIFDDCEDLENVLQAVSVLSAVTVVSLDWVSVFTTAGLIGRLCAVFPNVVKLTMGNSEMMDDEMLVALLPMQKLEHLDVYCCPRITGQGITSLLCQLPIKVLHCEDCERVSVEDAHLFETMMTAIGRQVTVHFVEA